MSKNGKTWITAGTSRNPYTIIFKKVEILMFIIYFVLKGFVIMISVNSMHDVLYKGKKYKYQPIKLKEQSKHI